MKHNSYLLKLAQKAATSIAQYLLVISMLATTVVPSPVLAKPVIVESTAAKETIEKLEKQRPVVETEESTTLPSVQVNVNK